MAHLRRGRTRQRAPGTCGRHPRWGTAGCFEAAFLGRHRPSPASRWSQCAGRLHAQGCCRTPDQWRPGEPSTYISPRQQIPDPTLPQPFHPSPSRPCLVHRDTLCDCEANGVRSNKKEQVDTTPQGTASQPSCITCTCSWTPHSLPAPLPQSVICKSIELGECGTRRGWPREHERHRELGRA